MILAIVLSILLHVRRNYQPFDTVIAINERGHVTAQEAVSGTVTEPGLIVYRFGTGIFYANATRLSEEALALITTAASTRWFVLDAAAVDDVDYSGGKTLLELADTLSERQVTFALSGLNDQVREQLERYGVIDKIGTDSVFDTAQAAIEAFHASTLLPAAAD